MGGYAGKTEDGHGAEAGLALKPVAGASGSEGLADGRGDFIRRAEGRHG